MVMLDFICMDSADLFGTGEGAKTLTTTVSSGIRTPMSWQVNQRFGPLGNDRRLDDDQRFNILYDNGIQMNKTITWQHVSNWLWLHVYLNWMSD